jgi:hypothetical protein
MFDYYEEKWYITILKWLGSIFLAFICLIILGLIISCFPKKQYHYEYIDLDNNNGIAKNCSYKFENIGRGGQGSPICELEDGTVKQVKEYKYIFDGKAVPIKEIFKEEK